MFGWVFGVTVYAASTVWGSFMAGLAAGSLIAAVVGDRVRRPLAWFGAAELVVGATAIASPALLHAAERAYTGVYASLPNSLAGLTLVRFVVGFAILIVPTTMMGRDAAAGGQVVTGSRPSGRARRAPLRHQHDRRDRRHAERWPVADSAGRHPANVRDCRGAEH